MWLHVSYIPRYKAIDSEQSLNFLYRSVGGVFMPTTLAATRNYAERAITAQSSLVKKFVCSLIWNTERIYS